MELLKLCRACLVSEVKLLPLHSKLSDEYSLVTSSSIHSEDGKPEYVCYECAHHIQSYARFNQKCRHADHILSGILLQEKQITQQNICLVDRVTNGLVSSLSYSGITITDSFDVPDIKLELPEERDFKFEEDVDDLPGSPAFSDDTSQTDVQNVSIKIDDESAISIEDTKIKLEENLSSDVESQDSSAQKFTRNAEKILKPLNTFEKIADKETSKKIKNVPKKTARKLGFSEDFASEIILSLDEQITELKERAKSLNFLNSPLKCDSCYKGFVDETAYENHMFKHASASGPHTCPVCHMRYDTVRRLKAHTVTSHSRRYQCNTCSHRSHTVNQAREHNRWHNGHVYVCNLCSMTFRKPTSHLTHMRKRHPTQFVCTACGDSFVGEHGLLMHRSKTHKITNRNEDATSAADGAAERFCAECNIQFDNVEAYMKHTVTSVKHALNPHVGTICRVCGLRFTETSALEEHNKVHAKAKNTLPKDTLTHLQCEQCNARFPTRSKLLAHTRRVHLGVKYNKNIVCEVCGKSCTSNATLKYHQRTHTGERPFPCSECDKRFPNTNQLRIHRRTHSDERPYRCCACDKCFRQKPALNRHMRIHTGVKPYECTRCGKCFSQSNSLKTHVHAVHLRLPLTYRSRKNPQPLSQEKTEELNPQPL